MNLGEDLQYDIVLTERYRYEVKFAAPEQPIP
jgi:hypothetical protein